ncbi:hypothetical protein ACFDAU_12940 [Sulfuriferula sp. GW1]|uniref:hypothetical protein n=1 Tax=Sulfuriferula sp. GW1 TaxID=3345111 RepID=UPI0039B02114
MKLRTLCAVAVLGGAMTVVRADPVVMGAAQMDAVTAAGANVYAIAQANATGRNVFTETSTNVFTLNRLPYLTGYGARSQAAVLAVATGPFAYIVASAKAGIINEQPDLTGYGAGGEAVALATATGSSAFAAASAGVVNMNGQTYLTGSAATGHATGLAIITAPIALNTTLGIAIIINGQPHWLPSNAAAGETIWSQPVMRPDASAPAVSVTSTEVLGGQLVNYTLTTGDQNGNTPVGDSTTMSLSFSKPPRSRIPPVFVIDVSGAIPVMVNALLVKPVAM